MKIHAPNLIFGHYLDMTKDPINIGFGAYGEFEIIKHYKGIVETQHFKSKNIITNYGLQALTRSIYKFVQTNGIFYYCHLGTGSTIPAATDTVLAAHGGTTTIKGSPTVSYSLGAVNDRWIKVTWTYALADAIGTWTEIGLSAGNDTTSPLFSHMLFKNEAGETVIVDKTAEDTLTIIYYLHFVRSSDAPTTNEITVNGTTITVESLILDNCLYSLTNDRWIYGQPNNSWGIVKLGTGTATLSTTQMTCHTPINANPITCKAGDVGTFYKEFIFEWAPAVIGEFNEAVYSIGAPERWQTNNTWYTGPSYPSVALKFSPTITKTDTSYKTRLRPRITWSRAS